MKKIDLIIVGSGNPDIIKLIEEINEYNHSYNIIGILEKNRELFGNKINGYEIIGGDELLESEFKDCAVINNVSATPKIHSQLSQKLFSYGLTNFPNLIHPGIRLKHLKLGIGNIIYENISFGSDVVLGDFNILFYGSVIGHQAVIGNYNLIGGNVMIGSRAKISDRIVISNSSTINNNISIHDDVFIGTGSVVINSIENPIRVFGNPARKMIL
jgi:UDP-3-O-[3-hydroxymyristoyl] glucosamine N-acyltransferase